MTSNPRQAGRGAIFWRRRRRSCSFYAVDRRRSAVSELHRSRWSTIRCRAATAPAYFAVLNQPLPTSDCSWRNDPASFDKLPAVLPRPRARASVLGRGGRLARTTTSSGSAKASRSISPRCYAETVAIAAISSRTSCARCGGRRSTYDRYGPISLGYRLGHLQGDSRVFRALVYNKSAPCCTCCGGWWATTRSSAGCGGSTWSRASRRSAPTMSARRSRRRTGNSLERFFERWI